MDPAGDSQQPLKAISVWLTGVGTGLVAGLAFILVARTLSADGLFQIWEMSVASGAPALVALLAARATDTGMGVLLAVAYLTLLVPVLGPAFGGTGSEPLWMFGALALVGGMVWSTPFALWALVRKRRPQERTEKS